MRQTDLLHDAGGGEAAAGGGGGRAAAAPQRRVTLKSIADRVGVQAATVSTVLNGSRSGTKVSDVTRQRILDVARELRYRPNVMAQSLRSQRSNTIGFYSGIGFVDAREPFFSEILNGLQDGCVASRKDLLLFGMSPHRRRFDLEAAGGSRYPEATEEEVFDAITNGKIDGLILMSSFNGGLADRLAASPLACVTIGEAVPPVPNVREDAAEGGRLVARHLAEKGHRRVYYRDRHDGPADQRGAAAVRLAALRAAAPEHGIEVTAVVRSADPHGALGPQEAAMLARMTAEPRDRRATAAVCWNDQHAYALLRHCAGAGIRVPGDLAVVGYDGFRSPYWPAERDLTAVRVGWSGLTEAAVNALVMLCDGRTDAVPPETLHPVSLKAGDTT